MGRTALIFRHETPNLSRISFCASSFSLRGKLQPQIHFRFSLESQFILLNSLFFYNKWMEKRETELLARKKLLLSCTVWFLFLPRLSFHPFQSIQRDKFMVISVRQVSAQKTEALRFVMPDFLPLTLSPRIIYQNVFNHSSSSSGFVCWFNFVVLLLSISCFFHSILAE